MFPVVKQALEGMLLAGFGQNRTSRTWPANYFPADRMWRLPQAKPEPEIG
jgi:hypothetical protein